MLKDYQRIGVDWMKARRGCILGDEQGLGKTIQAIYYLQETQLLPALVISPLSVLDNWRVEFEQFAPTLHVQVFSATQRDISECDVVLTTYEMVYKLLPINFKCLVVDEGHRLKNADSKIHRWLVEEYAETVKIILTGTPVHNNLQELMALIQFVRPEFDKLPDNLEEVLLRRTKDQVLELPSVEQVVIQTGLTAVQKKLYLAILQQDVRKLIDNKQSTINTLMNLRKAVSHPYMFRGVEPEPFQAGDHLWQVSGKMRMLHELLLYLKSKGSKVLIFCQFKGLIDILQDYLDSQSYSYERLDGSIRGQDRFETLDRYKKEAAFVFLLSSRAGGTGLNLVQADTVVFYDIDHNPQIDLQAAARAHRIGQTKPVKVVTLLSRGTCDEVIYRRGRKKLEMARGVLGDKMDEDIELMSGVQEIMETRDVDDVVHMDFDQLFAESIYQYEGQDYKVDRKAVLGYLLQDENVDQLEAAWKKRKLLSLEQKHQRLLKMWSQAGYVSLALPAGTEQVSDKEAEIVYISGDASKPVDNPAIVLHAVDTSGRWSHRGFFGALERLSPQIGQAYMRAYDMKDLALGQVHLVTVSDVKVGLMVCMKKGEFQMESLRECLQSLSNRQESLHMPRFQSSTVQWYQLERMFKKYLSQKCYVYYYARS